MASIAHARAVAADAKRIPARACLTRADDLVGLCHGFGAVDTPLQVSRGRLSAMVLRLEICGIELGYERCNQTFLIEDSGTLQAASLDSDTGTLEMAMLGNRGVLARPAHSQAWVVRRPPTRAGTSGAPAAKPPDQAPSDAAFWNATHRVLEIIQAETASTRQPDIALELDRAAILTILDTLGTRIARPRSTSATSTLGTLLKLMELASSHRSTRISALADDLRMTRRNLHYCATHHTGVAPKRLLKSLALRNVMLEMPAAARQGKTIGDLAFEHGFENFSAFCADYRSQFGERPSDTMQRYRAALP